MASVVAIILISVLYSPVSSSIDSMLHPKSYYGRIKVNWYRDYNDVQLKWAKKNGISPFKTSNAFHEGVDQLVKEKKLVRISSNRYYTVKRLSHSHPYLTPEAANLLNEIGKRFRKKLTENGLDNYRYQLSSLLRTSESQKRLTRSNVNATPNTSSHLYGTTFDISYKNLIRKPLPWLMIEVADARAIKLLSETIGELRAEKRCVVVTERLEHCFHITVAN